MSRRRFEPAPLGRLTPGWPIIRLRCSGSRGNGPGHKATTIAYVARAPEDERVVFRGVELGGFDVEYRHAADDLNAFRGSDEDSSHLTYAFLCARCKLRVPLQQESLRRIVDNAIALGIKDVPLDRD